LSGETSIDADDRIDKLGNIANSIDLDIGMTSSELERYSVEKGGGPKANILVQLKLLLKRSIRENFRSKAKLIIQTVQQVTLGLIYGGIYTLGLNQVRWHARVFFLK
jgi:hypothetical protein